MCRSTSYPVVLWNVCEIMGVHNSTSFCRVFGSVLQLRCRRVAIVSSSWSGDPAKVPSPVLTPSSPAEAPPLIVPSPPEWRTIRRRKQGSHISTRSSVVWQPMSTCSWSRCWADDMRFLEPPPLERAMGKIPLSTIADWCRAFAVIARRITNTRAKNKST